MKEKEFFETVKLGDIILRKSNSIGYSLTDINVGYYADDHETYIDEDMSEYKIPCLVNVATMETKGINCSHLCTVDDMIRQIEQTRALIGYRKQSVDDGMIEPGDILPIGYNTDIAKLNTIIYIARFALMRYEQSEEIKEIFDRDHVQIDQLRRLADLEFLDRKDSMSEKEIAHPQKTITENESDSSEEEHKE